MVYVIEGEASSHVPLFKIKIFMHMSRESLSKEVQIKLLS